MGSIYDVDAGKLIRKVAEDMKKIDDIKPPQWAAYVKTGVHKERPPIEKDWWHRRSAAVLRSIAKLGPVGVSKLRTKYGGKKKMGYRPEHFYKGSGTIIRKVLQQLEKAGLVKQVEKGVHKGRIISPKGKSLLDKAATSIRGPKPKKAERPKKTPARSKKAVPEPAQTHAPPVPDKPKEDKGAQKPAGKEAKPAEKKKETK